MSRAPVRSLDEVFEPPGQLRARFGWICGMTADGPFIDRAAERFSRQSTDQRSLAGRVYLGLLLDPSTPQIPPTSAYGVLHLPPRSVPLPFRLLHAKVALLGFGDDESDEWCLRLVVSTGNWTRQTMDQSLDLVWSVDLHRNHPPGPERSQAVADIKEAAAFLTRLRARFNDDALMGTQGAQASLTRASVEALDGWIAALPAPAGVQPRFLHNEAEALITRVARAARRVGGSTRRNYIVMGSGFFGGGSAGALPFVPSRVVSALRAADSGLLTAQPEVDLVVNPTACQGIAVAVPAISRTPRWRVLGATDPHGDTGGLRSLHAKFIFSANWRDGGSTTSPWLYLGSGNLTDAGFMHAALPAKPGGASVGNLEAGVVFVPGVVRWSDVGKWLPFRPSDDDLAALPNGLAAGPPAPERATTFAPPPFAFLAHDAVAGLLRPNAVAPAASLIWPGGLRTPAHPDGAFPVEGAPPPQVEVAWPDGGKELRAIVPVVDGEGRVAGVDRGPLTFEGLAEELGSFPDQPEVDLGSDESESTDGEPVESGAAAPSSPVSAAPLRDVMQAMELVAKRQTRIREGQWEAWVARLEQALVRMKDQPMVEAVRAVGVNPVAVLRLPAFRPTCCESAGSVAASAYEEALQRVERAWGVRDLPGLVDGES